MKIIQYTVSLSLKPKIWSIFYIEIIFETQILSVFDKTAKLGKALEDAFDFLMSRWLKVLLLTHMALVFREIGNYLCRQFSQKKIDDRLPVISFQKKRLGWDSSTIFEFLFRLRSLL